MSAPLDRSAAPVFSGDDLRPAYSEDGVDLTLVRWMLSLTPMERLDVAQSWAEALLEIRHDQAEG